MTPALAAPAVARDQFHSIRRTAPYKVGLMRLAPNRKLPGDATAGVRDPFRRAWKLATEFRGDDR